VRSRMHHYLPVWYLAGFTPSGRTNGRLWVHDLRADGRVWKAAPQTVARERDLYTVASGPTEPDWFERELAKYDDEHANLVRTVCQSRQLTTESLDDLLGFLALTYTRSPGMWAGMGHHIQQQTGLPVEKAVDDPENWRWLSEWLGQPLSAIHTVVMDHAGGEARTQLFHVCLIDVLRDLMRPLLKSRHWSLCVARDYVVCSSSPLGIAWPVGHPSSRRPKLGDEGATLTFPLDRHTALVSGLGDHCSVRHVCRSAVAQINSQTLRALETHAMWPPFAFAPAKQFYCMGNDGLLQVSGADSTLVGEPIRDS